MPPKMFKKMLLTFSSEVMTSIALDSGLGPRTTADIEEVRRIAARGLHDVERRHDQARTVSDDADVPVELDEVQTSLFCEPFLLRHLVCGSKLGEDGMAVIRRVIDGHLRVEGDDLAVAGQHQRVHLDERRIELDERPVELGDHCDRTLASVGVHLRPEDELARMEVADAERGIDVHTGDRVRVLFGDLLDLDAALGAHHAEELALTSVDEKREVVLLFDVAGSLDEHSFDCVAFDVHPENLLGDRSGLVRPTPRS